MVHILTTVDSPTISAVLGHADPDSTRVYMATHRGGMLACVLPVPEGGSS